MATTKRCSKCGKSKPKATDYHRDKQKRDGYASACKACRNPKQVEYERTHRKQAKSRSVSYRVKLQTDDECYLRHRVSLSMRGAAKRKAKVASWMYTKAGRSAVAALLRDTDRCTLCGTELALRERELDHTVPLSRGGMHTLANLAIMCRCCNQAKGVQTISELIAHIERIHAHLAQIAENKDGRTLGEAAGLPGLPDRGDDNGPAVLPGYRDGGEAEYADRGP